MEGSSKKLILSYSFPFTDTEDEEERMRLFVEYWVLRRQPRMRFVKYWQAVSRQFGMEAGDSPSPPPTFDPGVNYNVWQINQFYTNSSTSYVGSIMRLLELQVRAQVHTDQNTYTIGDVTPHTVGGGFDVDLRSTVMNYGRWSVWLFYDRSGWCKKNGRLPTHAEMFLTLSQDPQAVIRQENLESFLLVKLWTGAFSYPAQPICTIEDTVNLMGLPMGLSDAASNTTADELDYGCLFMMAANDVFVPSPTDPPYNVTVYGSFAMSLAYADGNQEWQIPGKVSK